MDLLDRVVLARDYTANGRTVVEGTIATVREYISETNVLIQYDFTNEPIYIGVPVGILSSINQGDLKDLKPSRLIPKMFHIGNRFSINNGKSDEIGTIIGITLRPNENKDEFKFNFGQGKFATLTKEFIEVCGTYVPFEEEGQQIPEEEKPEEACTISTITIDGITFTIGDNEIALPEKVEIDNIDKFINAINKIKKLCEEGN